MKRRLIITIHFSRALLVSFNQEEAHTQVNPPWQDTLELISCNNSPENKRKVTVKDEGRRYRSWGKRFGFHQMLLRRRT